VFDHQHGDAEFGLHVANPERHVVGLLDVQTGRRLIQQDQFRLRAQRTRQLNHLADAVGQSRDQFVAMGLEIEELDHLLDSAAMGFSLVRTLGRNSNSCQSCVVEWRCLPTSRLLSMVAFSNSSMFWKVRRYRGLQCQRRAPA